MTESGGTAGLAPAASWVAQAGRDRVRVMTGLPTFAGRAYLCGPALTCACAPGDNLAVHSAIRQAPPGTVIVGDGGGTTRTALVGEFMATEAANRGLGGIVIEGPVRDADDLDRLGFPVLCTGFVPAQSAKISLISVGQPVVVGKVLVRTGDQIVADRDGAVVVPAGRLAVGARRGGRPGRTRGGHAAPARRRGAARRHPRPRSEPLPAARRLSTAVTLVARRRQGGFRIGLLTSFTLIISAKPSIDTAAIGWHRDWRAQRLALARQPTEEPWPLGRSAGARASSRTRRWAITSPTTYPRTPTCWLRSASRRSRGSRPRKRAPRSRANHPPRPGRSSGPTGSPPTTTTRPSATGSSPCPAARASTSPTSPTTSTCSRRARSRT